MKAVSERVLTLAGVASREVAREYPRASTEDLRSEAVVWALANPVKCAEYEALEDGKQGDRLLYVSIRNRLRVCAQKETAHAYGYTSRGDMFAHYSEAQLTEDLLPCLFDRDLWATPPIREREDISSRSDPAHGNGWIAQLADVADAYRRLPAEERELVALRYRDDFPQNVIAADLGVSESTVSERLSRAVRRMVRLLGGTRPTHEQDENPIGVRRSVTNARAQHETRESYGE